MKASPVQCRLVEFEKGKMQPGDMWLCPWYLEHGEENIPFWLSDEYMRDHKGKRPPIMLALPNGAHWLLDGKASNGGNSGWEVTGEPPKLTANPSILAGDYHGWLRDGVLVSA